MKYNIRLRFTFSIFVLVLQCYVANGDDFFCNINNRRLLHKVSEKFLSISIDPAVLFAGVNLSDTSLLLAQKISPAYIRLAGPSTPYVKYIDDEDFYQQMAEKSNNVYVTPSMWFGINEWFTLANLTPVFSINDIEREKGVWDPKNVEPLVELSDKLDVNCYWQLGFDCSNKSLNQYLEDLSTLRQVLNKFPGHKNAWKIVGTDLRRCTSAFDEEIKEKLKNLDGIVDKITIEQSLNPYEEDFALDDTTAIPLWTTVRKNVKPVTFSSAILWAKQVGEAARSGYDVIFRQPRLKELSYVTPVYWFSFLHKKLMGTNVLEIKPSSARNSDTLIFAHCTKSGKQFLKQGAVTVMAVNDNLEKSIAKIRIFIEKSIDIRSYILTANSDESTDVYLNGRKLSMSQLHNFTLTPKVQRVKILNHVSLFIPPKSIAFYVIVGARFPVCEEQTLQAVNRNQDIVQNPKKISLENIKNQMLEELRTDNQFYAKNEDLPNHTGKFLENNKKNANNIMKKKSVNPTVEKNLNTFKLSIKEIENILKQRARQKAAEKNVQLDSAELNMIVEKATINLPKKMFSKRDTSLKRSKRDINKLLLDEKADFYKKNMFSQETFEKIYKNQKHKRNSNQETRIKRDINFDMLDKRTTKNNKKKSSFLIEELFNPTSVSARNKLSEKIIFDSIEQKPPSKFSNRMSLTKKQEDTKEDNWNDFDVFNDLGEFSYFDDVMFSSEFPQKKKVINELDLLEIWKEELKNKKNADSSEFDTNYGSQYDFLRKKRGIGSNSTATKEDLRSKRKTIKKELKDLRKKIRNKKSDYIHQKQQYLKNKIHTKFDRNNSSHIMKLENRNNLKKQTNHPENTNINRISKNSLNALNIEEITVPTNERFKRSIFQQDIIGDTIQNIKSQIDNNPVTHDVKNAIQAQIAETIFDSVNPYPLLRNNAIEKSIFGTYRPLSLSLRPWKPSNILNFNPLDPLNILSRRKRHLDDDDLENIHNLILDSDENKIDHGDNSKLFKNGRKKYYLDSNQILSSEHGDKMREISKKLSDKERVNTGLNLARNIIDITTGEVKKGIDEIGQKVKSPTRMPDVVGSLAQNFLGSRLDKHLETDEKSLGANAKNIAKKVFENGVGNLLQVGSNNLNEQATTFNDKDLSNSLPGRDQNSDQIESVPEIQYENLSILKTNPIKKIVHKTKHWIGELKNRISSIFSEIF